MRKLSGSRRLRALIWLLAATHGLLFISTTPLWEGFDEPFHYGYIQSLAEHGRLPVFGQTSMSEEVRLSFENAPLSRVVNSNFRNRYTPFEQFWELPDQERRSREQTLSAIPANTRFTDADRSNPALNNYEVHQPPLYYLLAVPVYRAFAGATLLTRVFALRTFSMFIGSVSIALAFTLGQRIWKKPEQMFAMPLLLATLPMFYSTTARISNDCLAVTLFTALAAGLIRLLEMPGSTERAIFVGGVLGLGLLTKAYFLTAVPAVIIILVFPTLNEFRRPLWRSLAIVLFVAVAISGWWYARNLTLYGNLSGMQEITLNSTKSLWQRIADIGRVPWASSMGVMIQQHIWVGNSSFIGLSRTIYRAGDTIIILALIGVAVGVVRKRPSEPIYVSMTLYALFVAGLTYHMLVNFELINIGGGTGGWYLYAVIVPEIVLLIYGLTSLANLASLQENGGRYAGILLVTYAALLHFVGIFCKALPFYAGFFIPRFHLAEFVGLYAPSAFQLMLDRLCINKPVFLRPSFLGVLILLDVLLLIASYWSFVRTKAELSSQ